jgi:hypothetical protein
LEKLLSSGIKIASTRKEHAPALEELQILCFPTLDDDQRFKSAHYVKHIELFPEGQFVALDGDKVVGMTSTIRMHFDFAHVEHTFADVIQGGWLTSHEPDGDWLYEPSGPIPPIGGAARPSSTPRASRCARSGSGQVTVNAPRPLGAGEMSPDYTITARASDFLRQMSVGFEPRGLLPDYLNDPVCDNYGVLLVLTAEKDVPFE